MTPRSRRLLAAAVLVAMTVAACTSDEAGDADGPATSTPDESTATTATTSVPSSSTSTTSSTTTSTTVAAAEPSPGCAAAALPAGRQDVFITSGGATRSYSRYVPVGLVPGEPAPLVVDFPAYSPGSLEEDFSGFTKAGADGAVTADEVGAVVVTPEPTNGSGLLLTWNYVGTPGWSDDQQFVTDLLDDIEATACIDTSRVLATGFAVGAVFASITVCAQAERFAALATVSGLYDPAGCDPSRTVPVISFHGTGDRFIPFDGGVGDGPASLGLTPETIEGLVFMAGRPGAVASSTAWAAHAGCDQDPDESAVTDGVSRQRWSGCRDGAAVELYVLDGGEHTWPGSVGMGSVTNILGPVSNAVDATDLIWEFFAAAT